MSKKQKEEPEQQKGHAKESFMQLRLPRLEEPRKEKTAIPIF
jgi:hypothetical protein